MRPDQIKFRGKLVTTGKWVYGDLLHIAGGSIIYHGSHTEHDTIDTEGVAIELLHGEVSVVNPDTIGQYTTVNDVNDKPSYDGDIVRVYHNGHPSCYQIVFHDGCFRLADGDGRLWHNIDDFPFEVIGNIFDNKDLLED